MDERDNSTSYYSDANTPLIRNRYKIIWFAVKLLVVAVILVIRFKTFSVERSYERKWNLKFSDAVMLLEDHKAGSHGENEYRYTVFDVKRVMRQLQVYYNYQNQLDDVCEDIMNQFGSEVNERPDFDSELTYGLVQKDDKELIMIYSPSKYRLYFFIHNI